MVAYSSSCQLKQGHNQRQLDYDNLRRKPFEQHQIADFPNIYTELLHRLMWYYCRPYEQKALLHHGNHSHQMLQSRWICCSYHLVSTCRGFAATANKIRACDCAPKVGASSPKRAGSTVLAENIGSACSVILSLQLVIVN